MEINNFSTKKKYKHINANFLVFYVKKEGNRNVTRERGAFFVRFFNHKLLSYAQLAIPIQQNDDLQDDK